MVASTRSFDYIYSPINKLRVETEVDKKTGMNFPKSIVVNDEPMKPTERFWTSLFARYGFNRSFFKYFDYTETFNRISEVSSNDKMRMCIDRSGDRPQLLAVSHPRKPIVDHDDLMGILENYGGENISYSNGIIESTHRPRSGVNTFDVTGDAHENRFTMQTPIDGYGMPSIYLSLLRQICTNGMVGLSKAFRSTLSLGSGDVNVGPSIIRALDGFSNDEGYAAIRQRLEAAATSWLSVSESQKLYKTLVSQHHAGHIQVEKTKGSSYINRLLKTDGPSTTMGESTLGSPIITAFHRMTGDPAEAYGLANLDALSSKRQKTLPVKCTVYDAINFATEVATHHSDTNGARRLNAWVGTAISEEYDMEGTKDKFGEFADFLIDSKIRTGVTGSQYQMASVN